ncbi:E3 ubiquitin-protein ligase MSL2-like isoform X2 [Scleropages formosus]|uniref:E3 ubiquitin-protein ligase MSL2-like isoform X2 n=1 Tax=Scleropages formosus TaxID=113540 RepID=UPI000878BEB4|nr:E3 ubiquitin-protein ligase MSL2-like isoform X2 [Scleropages formosus]
MNPVNATALYVSACRSVLQSDPLEPQSVAELCKLLPFFRQSLSCLVCGNLLQEPIAPTNSSCQHYVCKGCKGQKMMMKPSCSWCKDYKQFEENKQLSILVGCFRKLCEGDPEDSHLSLLLNLPQSSPAAPSSEEPSGPQLEAPDESFMPSPASPRSSVNGLPGCNGLTGVDELTVSLPSTQGGRAYAPDSNESVPTSTRPESFGHTLSACKAVAGEELCAEGIDICGFGEDIKHSSDPLMLSVEEVLRTLEPEPEPVPGVKNCSSAPRPGSEMYGKLNGPSADASCQLPPGVSSSTTVPQAARLSRKRSRSESDSEKVQPLPISTIIQGSPLAAAVVTAAAAVAVKREPKVASVLPLATVPNGGAPKVGKTLLVSVKGNKKGPEHLPRKAYAKAKQGLPKTKEKTKDHLASNSSNGNLMSGSPTKVVYKKTQEKKGCKCGRATQNPSVLTCRGQRCPCYSNRKACLDCICRGCQNSYMANGEKKLEAFAVPEKALEQTRLTLGINVTSIAVRSAGTSGGVALNVTAGSPVASFLAASSHEDKTLEESLDMRFDC